MTRTRIAVLASGGGSNLQALLQHHAALGSRRQGDVVLVASDRAGARALVLGAHAAIACTTIDVHSAAADGALDALLAQHDIQLVVLAGYLKLVPAGVTRRFAGRMLNVHPAPLPRFGGPGMYGARVHRAVLAAGMSTSGPTVHFVNEDFDRGAVIAHWPVPVHHADDEATLAARVLRAEHLLYPRVVEAVAAGSLHGDASGALSRRYFARPYLLPPFDASLSDAALADQLERAHALTDSSLSPL